MSEVSRRTLLKRAGVAGLAIGAPGALASAVAAAAPAAIERFTLFPRGVDGYLSYRPPGLHVSAKGTLLAFAGARPDHGEDFGPQDTVLKRSFDGGKTWGPLQVVATDDQEPARMSRSTVVDYETGRIHVMVVRTAGHVTGADIRDGLVSPEDAPRPFHMYSDDDGETWSDWRERDLTDVLKVPGMRNYVIGPGTGIQLTKGPHKGRLLFTGYHSILPREGDNHGIHGVHTVYSDDHGDTWQLGGAVGAYTDGDQYESETSVVELPDGTLYFNTRDEHGPALGTRAATTSSDGGATFDRRFEMDEELVTTVVHCAMTSVPAVAGRPERIVLTGPTHPTSRERMSVRSSFDGGETWHQGPVVYDGPASYSNSVVFTDDKNRKMLGIVFEGGKRISPGDGVSFWREMYFAKVPLVLLDTPPRRQATTPDESGHGNHGVISGAVRRAPGAFGRGLELAGECVDVPLTKSLDVADGPFTVAAWMRSENQEPQRLVHAYYWDNARAHFEINVLPARIRGTIVTDSAHVNVESEMALSDGDWHHVVMSRDDFGRANLYIDGALAASATGALGSVSQYAMGGIRFGARLNSLDSLLIGQLDELYLFGAALTAEEVARLHSANTGPLDSVLFHLPLDRVTGR